MAFGIVPILGIVTANPILPWNESRYAFSNSLALGNCVQQQMSAICPDNSRSTETVCVPIEPVEDDTPPRSCFPHGRHLSWKGDRCVIYKPEILGCRQNFPRFIYIDMGAEHYPSSMGNWFRHRYPNHDAFQLIALEADPFKNGLKGGKSWRSHREVEMLKFAAWTSNTTVEFLSEGFGAHMTGDQNLTGEIQRGNRVDLRKFGDPKQTKHLVQVQTLDVADLLHRRVTPRDYVVVKMDVSYPVCPRLIVASAIVCLMVSHVSRQIEGAEYEVAEGAEYEVAYRPEPHRRNRISYRPALRPLSTRCSWRCMLSYPAVARGGNPWFRVSQNKALSISCRVFGQLACMHTCGSR